MNDPASLKSSNDNGNAEADEPSSGPLDWLKTLFGIKAAEGSARDVLEELIEEREEAEVPIDAEERLLMANILELKGRTIHDVMVPRADIVSIECETGLSELIDLLTREGHSRVPVFNENLDDSIGMIHIKDVLAWRGKDEDFALRQIVRKVLFVPPSMQVLELLLEMRATRCHMSLVVDEFGGIDGLVTIEDLVEEIVGEIEDEHDRTDEPAMVDGPNATIVADARVPIEMLEQRLGIIVSDEEREDIDTLGGLVFLLAGRVPVRGELISHPSGIEFEILDADPRRIKTVRLRGAEALTPPYLGDG
ncbi:MAG: HlyC/CorC family transporter [Rhodospirillaceae bacterium]|jgi:magnesium and cobalt transporter|nr:HlyC/CorC family transporter [Rhodospirillaceae bacterium]MBT5243060.1 HlyC/CorC family transporter [Rhodospirillaceae bacterium]MBT5563285.1 HlyC/CorC family transporter [Rhodospirillaceae bacterium]MBT6243599.1 HlyC/CorC family transporter [Rhodospirillaceae bacterium]MBT7136469.1 HlyC/CorC family transporter [Rhodospirillaceae bacterium]